MCPHAPLAGSNRLLSIMRVNNDMLCDLAALVELDDSSLLAPANGSRPEGGGRLAARFLRFAFVPGLGVGHPAILYDEASISFFLLSAFFLSRARRGGGWMDGV
jgi:hypothetical protein